jgi:hypothetical protein
MMVQMMTIAATLAATAMRAVVMNLAVLDAPTGVLLSVGSAAATAVLVTKTSEGRKVVVGSPVKGAVVDRDEEEDEETTSLEDVAEAAVVVVVCEADAWVVVTVAGPAGGGEACRASSQVRACDDSDTTAILTGAEVAGTGELEGTAWLEAGDEDGDGLGGGGGGGSFPSPGMTTTCGERFLAKRLRAPCWRRYIGAKLFASAKEGRTRATYKTRVKASFFDIVGNMVIWRRGDNLGLEVAGLMKAATFDGYIQR